MRHRIGFTFSSRPCGHSRGVRSRLRRFVIIASLIPLLVVAAFSAGVLWPQRGLPAAQTSGPLAIVDVSVVDVETGAVVPNRTVVISEGRIHQVVEGTLKLPRGTKVVDGRGKFLMPGLWDMHAHVYAISPMLDLPLYIAFGVTSVRDMQGCPEKDDPFIACADEKRRWSDEAMAGRGVGPRIVSSTSFMANGPGMVRRLGDVPEYFDTANADQARRFVAHFAGSVDEIKVYDGIPREAYFALVDEARRRGLAVVGHRPRAVSAIEAAAHQKSIEHARFLLQESFPGSAELRTRRTSPVHSDRARMLSEHDPGIARRIFAAMREHGTWYVPTHLTRWSDAYADDSRVSKDPLLRYVHPLLERQWREDLLELLAEDPSPGARETYRRFYEKGLALTGEAHRAGVQILAGSDYLVAGADLHRELEQLAAAGLSAAAVLRAATLSPARYYDLEHHGTVAEGKIADLVLLRANPLADVRNTRAIEAVITNGNYYDRVALDRITAHVERQARSWAVGCKIVWRFLKNPAAY